MVDIPLSRGDYYRAVAKEARILTKNRYFEQNPILTGQNCAMIARPGLRRFLFVGDGPIRGVYSQSGSFDDAAFVVSGTELYRVATDDSITHIGTVPSSGLGETVSMAATSNIGTTPAYLFVCAGGNLKYYDGTTYGDVATPGGVAVIGLAYIASFVVVVPAQGQGINGRFFWIQPGEITIDPLDFATAERAPDAISGVVVFGDQFWLPGETTTETWYFTGNADVPVLRVQGVLFDRGAWAGTALPVKDSMIIVDNDGAVFQIKGGVKRISRPDIEERIGKAIAAAAGG